ncbi:hypothetical protein RJ639_022533 [Escallonia herrerae]|uniref:Eukaryotic translation initiation factor 2A n=1 Tax=Escallonia herrerae TaxID=1293975 RepID=A0AA89AHJ3_9ASTE|nr:hypothetical protein RJ639_022533 [Escallonia herrerae]
MTPVGHAVREPGALALWTGPPFANGQPSIKLDKIPCTNAKFSDNGSKLMVIKSESTIGIYDCKSSKELRTFEVLNLLAATLSPCGTYLQTFQKALSPQQKNVTLWKVETGDLVYQLFQKNMTKASWPSIVFSSDEDSACRLATNEIQLFDAGDFSKGIIHRIRVPGIAGIELSKKPGSHVAAFVPESKGMPASVQIFACGKDLPSQPVARRSFFRCSTVQLSWNYGSTGLLIVVQSDVDKTNQSYYGESKLNYLTTDGTHDGVVPLQPALLIDLSTIEHNLELGPRIESSSPFLTVNGGVDAAFWDYMEKKQLGTTKAEWSVTSEWSPDGRYFMTATTAPRLQVDNGIKIFHHNGSLYFKKMFDKLYQVDWKPESPDKFGEIAEVVKSLDSLKVDDTKMRGQVSKSTQAPTKSSPANPPAQKPAAYRPPHAKDAASVQAESSFTIFVAHQALRFLCNIPVGVTGEGGADCGSPFVVTYLVAGCDWCGSLVADLL